MIYLPKYKAQENQVSLNQVITQIRTESHTLSWCHKGSWKFKSKTQDTAVVPKLVTIETKWRALRSPKLRLTGLQHNCSFRWWVCTDLETTSRKEGALSHVGSCRVLAQLCNLGQVNPPFWAFVPSSAYVCIFFTSCDLWRALWFECPGTLTSVS